MVSSTVRITPEARKSLREIADSTGQSMQEVLSKAIEDYRRKTFLETANAAFAALRNDARAWKQEQEEREAWDATLSDGLENGK